MAAADETAAQSNTDDDAPQDGMTVGGAIERTTIDQTIPGSGQPAVTDATAEG